MSTTEINGSTSESHSRRPVPVSFQAFRHSPRSLDFFLTRIFCRQNTIAWRVLGLSAREVQLTSHKTAVFQRKKIIIGNVKKIIIILYTVLGTCETKTEEVLIFSLFFKIDPCSAISFKRSRRELSIDVAEHRSTL